MTERSTAGSAELI